MFVPENSFNSNISGLGSMGQFPVDNNPQRVDLASIRGARGNINEIRLLLRGNEETCRELFREAVEEGDAITQIQLSHALFGIKWGKDQEKDFSALTVWDLEEFSYYPREFVLFNSVYDEVMGLEQDWQRNEARGIETFAKAADQGYLPALLELRHTKWKWNANSYGFAVQLRPFVGKGDKQLDYYFGKALKNGCQIGSERYYEGLYWMEQSCGISVKYPKEHQSFDSFKRHYTQSEDCMTTYHDHDGLYHVGDSVVLAPSKDAWKAFKNNKLADVKIASPESYLFEYDPEQIKSLMNEYKIGAVHCGSFVEHPTMGREIEGWRGEKLHGFCIDTLSMYENDEHIGNISVQEDTFAMHQTISIPKIQPVIDFIVNVMVRTGSAGSAHSWLRQMGSRYV